MESISKIPTFSPTKPMSRPRPHAASKIAIVAQKPLLVPSKRSDTSGIPAPTSPRKIQNPCKSIPLHAQPPVPSKKAGIAPSRLSKSTQLSSFPAKSLTSSTRPPPTPIKAYGGRNTAQPVLQSVDEKGETICLGDDATLSTSKHPWHNHNGLHSKLRLSLSDRTVDSLARLPSTPATVSRRSSFFGAESPMATTPSVIRSKPSSVQAKRKPQLSSLHAKLPYPRFGSARNTPSTRTRSSAIPSVHRKQSHQSKCTTISESTAKAAASSIEGCEWSSSAMSSLSQLRYGESNHAVCNGDSQPESPQSAIEESIRHSLSSSGIVSPDPDSGSDIHARFARTSAALREQIARVKASNLSTRYHTVSTSGSLEVPTVPHNIVGMAATVRHRVQSARTSGHLDVAGLGLTEITKDIRSMDTSDCDTDITFSSPKQIVAVSSLNMAQNLVDQLTDLDFPDTDASATSIDDIRHEAPFSGLEALDMRDNRLETLPIGLRRLVHLTVLDLSHNRLGNSGLEVVAQITGLKHLNISHNKLSGHLPVTTTKLVNLKSLDLSGNKLLSLPDSLRHIRGLRVLNVSSNQLTGLPMDALEILPLTDLNASSNALVGALFSFGVSSIPSLKSLDVSDNTLASLAFSENVSLPALQTLNVSGNRMIGLPDMSSWTALKVLVAHKNMISELPTGFTGLSNLRHVDLSSNALCQLDPRIPDMKHLDVFHIANNPLDNSHVATMTTADLRQGTTFNQSESSFEDEAIDVRSLSDFDSGSPWQVTRSGTVLLVAKKLEDADADSLRAFLGVNDVRELSLAKNLFTEIPFEVCLAQSLRSLDISCCALADVYLSESMHLPFLQEFILASNNMSSLKPLLSHLRADSLERLDISQNALTNAVPQLREVFPCLMQLRADDNGFDSVNVEALRGLDAVYLSRNKIGSVSPELGLLAFDGLRVLEIENNGFHAPDAGVLARGTASTLEWLRAQIPGYEEPETTY